MFWCFAPKFFVPTLRVQVPGTNRMLSSESGEPFNGQPGSLALPYHEPGTPFLCFFLQLASWNLQLSFYKRLANSKNEEQILALERITGFLGQRRTSSFDLSYPPTPAFCFFLLLASWNLQLSFYKQPANSKNEEQVLALERRTDYPRRAVNRSTVNQVLSLFPTTNPLPPTSAFPFLPYNLHLGTCN